MNKKILNQVVQVKETHWQAFAPCFLGVWLCKNFSSQGLLFGGCGAAGNVQLDCFRIVFVVSLQECVIIAA
ncbi:MAG: hypothetical protein FWE67_01930 [Planctomycetaceae bacterium]|nr:hypothetical protein [Planctomycetaceae bacterium]